MHRFFINSKNISCGKIIIKEKEQLHHLSKVLRLKLGEDVSLVDEKGLEYVSQAESIFSKEIIFKIKKINRDIKAKNPGFTIACAIPKKAKFDHIVDKLTQLGVDEIIPMITERTIVKPDKARGELRLRRWEKIAFSAALQSKRMKSPKICAIKSLREVLSDSKNFELKILPTLAGERKFLQDILSLSKPKNILALIGPEGDFTDEEINLAKQRGFIPVNLGDLVLRVDTAAISIASYIKFLYQL